MRKQRVVAIALILALTIAGGAGAQNIIEDAESFSLGAVFGEPTGISAKLWLGSASAVDAAVAWGIGGARLHFHMNYLQHFFDVFDTAPDRLPLYVGIGGNLQLRADGPPQDGGVRIGARVPVGISFLPSELPLDFFLEVAPGLRLIDETVFELWSGIGIRYRF